MPDVTNYSETINRLKREGEAARLHAALTVNKQMLILYRRIGKIILPQQESQGWGTKRWQKITMDLSGSKAHLECGRFYGIISRRLKF